MEDLPLSTFEAAILEHVASKTSDPALRAQLDGIRVSKRENTGAGCYTTLLPPGEAPATEQSYGVHGPLEGPNFESASVEGGGGTLLWFENGRVDRLEIFAYGEHFPADHDEIESFSFVVPDLPS